MGKGYDLQLRSFVQRRIENYLKATWLCLTIFIGYWGVSHGGETSIVAIYFLWALTLPLGLAAYVAGTLCLIVLGKLDSNFGLAHNFAISVVMSTLVIAAGFIQWFILFPKIFNRMKNERSPKAWGLVLLGLIVILFSLYRFYIRVFPNSF